MSSWLDPVCRRLDELPQPASIFFRDDDAGWEDARLFALLDIFDSHYVPIDLAAIPLAISDSLAGELSRRMATSRERVRIHQHGYAHNNHESAGRKCEFGPSRGKAAQKRDIEAGQRDLRKRFGNRIDPIFTPPWNRCTVETGECLVELGIKVLSRESGAAPLGLANLLELPIELDWFAHRKNVRIARCEWAERLASRLAGPVPIGIMFHHAIMEREEMQAATELLATLAARPNVRFRAMLDLIQT